MDPHFGADDDVRCRWLRNSNLAAGIKAGFSFLPPPVAAGGAGAASTTSSMMAMVRGEMVRDAK